MSLIHRIRERLANDPRLASILHGSFSGLVGRGAGLLISAVTLPLTLRYLGQLEYGVWVTISTSVVMLSVLDLGIANTLTNLVSKAYADRDDEQAQRYIATAFWLTMLVAGCIGLIAYFFWRVADWGAIFHLADAQLVARAKACVGISICFFLVGLPLSLANRVLSSYQQNHLANYFAMINNFLGLVAILVVVATKGSIVTLMAAFCVALLTGTTLLNVWLFVWHKPALKPLPQFAQLTLARSFVGDGLLFFILQLCNIVVFQSDNLVITHYLGPSEVTPYSVAWRLISYASLMQGLLTPSLWPAFSEAYHRRDLDWMRRIYRKANRGSLLLVGAIALAMALGGRTIIRIWAGPAAVPGALLLWCMALWAVLVSATTNQSIVLTATGRLRLEASVAVAAAAANLFLSIHLVKVLGPVGVILSTILSFLILMLGPQEFEVRRVLSGKYLKSPFSPQEAEAHAIH
ncbi:lipopolysaccharide biosynthesis protein [Acidipila sp. EB88]|uniref:lipopolysaccharide biosynthesis protein n=1 Tax=Acidipila sp. EB88 TaxID=2305226 RepID=UPI000F600539|nr:oligosaccharide flippase family protein [Acidipila sp. EB88]RRA47455.1 hypothetical protein D1Y84_03235 [Acidipila sp. EB88]